MEKIAIDYADFAEYDRRQRDIQRHVLAAFLGGLVVGAVGVLISDVDVGIYDPYVYLALTVAVGATATGFGWALLTTFLASASILVAAMGGSALAGDLRFEAIGGSASGLNLLVAQLVVLGLLAYFTRRPDVWGDLAAGAISGLVLADVIDRATPGGVDWDVGFWPVPAVIVGTLAVAGAMALRHTMAGRARAATIAFVVAGVLAVALFAL
ncbi:hypothetical protein ACFXJ8_10290 [Nonomuraea sp. NPDC059194]|uniref:hypothetical protein n=1 Tax=Nonomuraea sp. NPDC059194 TaxID=3346764 RepID=UPI003690D7D9